MSTKEETAKMTSLSFSSAEIRRKSLDVLLRAFGLSLALLFASHAGAQAIQPQVETIDNGQFQIHSVRSGPDLPIAVAGGSKDGRIGVGYEGPCVATVQLELLVANTSDYERSGRVADLGANELLRIVSEQLTKICPAVVEVEAKLGNAMGTPIVARLARRDNWNVTNGSVVGKAARFALRDTNSAAFVDGPYRCALDVSLPLQTDQSSQARPTIQQLEAFAGQVASRLSQDCVEAQHIRFATRPQDLPPSSVCDVTEGACYFLASREAGASEWDVSRQGIFIPGRIPQIRDFDTMIRMLLAGEKSKVLDFHQSYYRVFHNAFLRAYSEQCARFVESPVTLEVTPMERTVDGAGNVLSASQTADSYLLTIRADQQGRYISFENSNRAWLVGRMFSIEAMGRSGNRAGIGPSSVVSQLTRDFGQVKRFVSRGCTSPDVQQIYQLL